MFDLLTSPFLAYAESNRKPVPVPKPRRRGHFDFRACLGQPLSDKLFGDIIHLLAPVSLRVYVNGEDDEDSHWYQCCLYLGLLGTVERITTCADVPHRKSGVVFEKQAGF